MPPLFSREHILAYAADGADKILGQIFKLSAGSDTVVGIADLFIVYPAASVTNVFHSIILLYILGDIIAVYYIISRLLCNVNIKILENKFIYKCKYQHAGYA